MPKLKGPLVLILVQATRINRKAAKAAGLSYYFAPKPCGKCGTSVRLIGGTCRACKAVQSREWLAAHDDGQEYMRLASRKYQEANRETCRKRSKAWKKRTGWTEDPAYRAAHTGAMARPCGNVSTRTGTGGYFGRATATRRKLTSCPIIPTRVSIGDVWLGQARACPFLTSQGVLRC